MGGNGASDNPIVRALQLLTTGWGYNFYNDTNRARADDLLIREKSAHLLGEAAMALSALETAYRRRFIPAATREQPFPPPETMERLRAIGELKGRISGCAVRIRSASVPAQDKIWFRLRDERTLLLQLLTYDESLIAASQQVAEMARALTAPAWNAAAPDEGASAFDAPLADLDDTLRQRTDLLQMPTL